MNTIRYNGPPECQKAWERFVKTYTDDGKKPGEMNAVNFLNDQTFLERQDFLQAHPEAGQAADRAAADKAWETLIEWAHEDEEYFDLVDTMFGALVKTHRSRFEKAGAPDSSFWNRICNTRTRPILDEREQEVLRLRYALDGGVPQSQDEIGARLQLSHTAVQNIERKALAKLRRELGIEQKPSPRMAELLLRQQEIEEAKRHLRGYFMREGRKIPHAKLAEATGLPLIAIHTLLGENNNKPVTSGGALSDRTRNGLREFIANDLNQPGDAQHFVQDFDALRQLTGYTGRSRASHIS